jgi:signal transduction histidine kinase
MRQQNTVPGVIMMDMSFYRSCKLFDNMSEEEITTVIEGAETITIPTGASVISEHALGDSLFVIVKGSVEINKELAEKDDNMVAQLKVMQPGEFFGEMALIDNEPRSANVVSRDNVELLVIPKERFLNIAYTNPKVLFNLIRTLSWRLRDTNQKFAEVMEKLIAQNRLMAIGMAASKIMHDIKTPLNVISLTAELVENLCPDTKEFAESIVRQSKSIEQMVLEILDFARGKQTPISPQKVKLDSFLNEIRDTFEPTLAGRDIRFELNNQVQQDVFFDESKIRRVIINLLKNSSEAMTVDGYIRIAARMDSGFLIISVSDDGRGVPEHIKNNLFSPFQTEGKRSGTGLGLAITQKLVHEHKGTIEHESNHPRGTVFTVRLPQEDIK